MNQTDAPAPAQEESAWASILAFGVTVLVAASLVVLTVLVLT